MMTPIETIAVPPAPEAGRPRQVNAGGNGEAAERQKAALKKVSQDFEALFVGMMLKSMRATVGKDTLTGGGHGEEVYRSLLDQEYALSIARGGGLGLAENIERQLGLQIGYGGTDDDRAKP